MVVKKLVEDLISASYVDTYNPRHQFGPDYIIPTDENRTWTADGAVNINVPQSMDPRFEPVSVISFFRTAVENSPNRAALVVNRNNVILQWTYAQYWDSVWNTAKGFIKLGLTPFNAVAILGANSPEWVISYLAAIFSGGFPAGIYTTNSSEACFHVLENSLANIVVVDTEVQLDKILAIRDKLPNLKAIVQYDGNSNHPEVISWQDLQLIGQSLPDEVLNKRIKGVAINQCCSLIYTSGTTGNPKGVMISHDNIIVMVKNMTFKISHTPKYGKTVSYLPLSHVAALVVDFYLAILTEAAVHFAHPDALKGKLVEDLTQTQPTYFMGVPRVYEKMKDKLETVEESLPPIKKKLVQWARKRASEYNQRKNESTSIPILYSVAKALVLNKVKKAMGLQDVQFFLSGGAPISVELFKFLQSYDFPIHEAFGLSECSGAHVITVLTNHRMGSVGNVRTLKDLEFKIFNPNSDGSGEIMLNGRNIFMGYLSLEEATKEALEEDKWLHTGDVGYIDKDGFIFITGRIKELIITSGGENIPPVVIEERIKKLLPVISNCMLVGEKRKYLTMLLTLKTEIDLNTMEPIDDLNPIAINWCQSVGSSATRVSEILESCDPKVVTAIQEGINEYNEKFAISRAQRIQKWKILTQDFCINNGTLGPTSKLIRQFVANKYSRVIESMYSN